MSRTLECVGMRTGVALVMDRFGMRPSGLRMLNLRLQVNSLHIFHYKGHTGGIKFRAQLPNAAQIHAFCAKKIPFRKNLKIPIPHFSSHNQVPNSHLHHTSFDRRRVMPVLLFTFVFYH